MLRTLDVIAKLVPAVVVLFVDPPSLRANAQTKPAHGELMFDRGETKIGLAGC
jgi:hypothetical protein